MEAPTWTHEGLVNMDGIQILRGDYTSGRGGDLSQKEKPSKMWVCLLSEGPPQNGS